MTNDPSMRANGEDGPPTAEELKRMRTDAARWQRVWQCVRMDNHGGFVVLPEDPTGLPEDSLVRTRFLRDVDEFRT